MMKWKVVGILIALFVLNQCKSPAARTAVVEEIVVVERAAWEAPAARKTLDDGLRAGNKGTVAASLAKLTEDTTRARQAYRDVHVADPQLPNDLDLRIASAGQAIEMSD